MKLSRTPIRRRRLLRLLAGAAAAGATLRPANAAAGPPGSLVATPAAPVTPAPAAVAVSASASASASAHAPARAWRNWSGLQACRPARWLVPTDELDLARALPGLPGPLRAVGAGHSFSPLVPTGGTLIALDRLGEVGAVDPATQTVRVGAGVRLARLASALHEQGWALDNQPDVDVQTLAGALATGTHGTGAALPALHDTLVALRLLTPAGQAIECSRTQEPALFEAARVSLGALGIVTACTLRVRPRFKLRRRVWLEPSAELIARLGTLARAHRHFECFVLPFTGYAAAVTHDEVDEPVDHPRSADEDVLRDLKRLRDWLSRWPALRRWLAQRLIDPSLTEHAVDWSPRLLSTVRPTRFNESEVHVAAAAGPACLHEVLRRLERRHQVFFPIECRFVGADDAWLSPFHGRDSCSIAVHAAHDEPHDYLWADLAPLWHEHRGRPHWGKLHAWRAAELARLYPHWGSFARLRERLDPGRRLLTPALAALLEGAPDG